MPLPHPPVRMFCSCFLLYNASYAFFFFNTRKTCLEMSDLFPESQWKVTEYSVLGEVNSLLSKLTGFHEMFPFSLNGIVQREEKPEVLCHKTCGCLSVLDASVQEGWTLLSRGTAPQLLLALPLDSSSSWTRSILSPSGFWCSCLHPQRHLRCHSQPLSPKASWARLARHRMGAQAVPSLRLFFCGPGIMHPAPAWWQG